MNAVYYLKITGPLGWMGGSVELENGVLVTPLSELTDAQKLGLRNERFWTLTDSVSEAEQIEESPVSAEEQSPPQPEVIEPPKRKRGRPRKKAIEG